MDSSVAQLKSKQEDMKAADAEETEESELETEDDDIVEAVRRKRPAFRDMRSEGSWSAMSDRDPVKAFRHLMGAMLGPSPVTSPRRSLLMTPHMDGHRRDSTMQQFRKLVGGMLQTPVASPSVVPHNDLQLVNEDSSFVERDSNSKKHHKAASAASFKFPRKSFRSPRKSYRSPRRSLLMNERGASHRRGSFLSPRASYASGRSSHRRQSTLKAFRYLAGAMLRKMDSPSSRRASMLSQKSGYSSAYSSHGTRDRAASRGRKETYSSGQRKDTYSGFLATPGGKHARNSSIASTESAALFDAIVGALVRLKTQTPRSKPRKMRGKNGKKKKFKLVLVSDDSEDSDSYDLPRHGTTGAKLTMRDKANFFQLPRKKGSKNLEVPNSDESDDDEPSVLVPMKKPTLDEQKPSNPDVASGSTKRLADNDSLPAGNPRLGKSISGDEQKPSTTDHSLPTPIDLEPKQSMSGGEHSPKARHSRTSKGMKTIRVINLKNSSVRSIDTNSTHTISNDDQTLDTARSFTRLGDLHNLRTPTSAPPSQPGSARSGSYLTRGFLPRSPRESGELLLRLIDLHSKQSNLKHCVSLASQGAEYPESVVSHSHQATSTMDDHSAIVMRLSELGALSTTSSTRTPAGKRPLRRQKSETILGSARKTKRKSSFSRIARMRSEPELRLRPLINPKTRQANCSIM